MNNALMDIFHFADINQYYTSTDELASVIFTDNNPQYEHCMFSGTFFFDLKVLWYSRVPAFPLEGPCCRSFWQLDGPQQRGQ